MQKEGKVLKETWDIPKYLSLESENLLEDLDEQYWEDLDNLCQKGWQHYLFELIFRRPLAFPLNPTITPTIVPTKPVSTTTAFSDFSNRG